MQEKPYGQKQNSSLFNQDTRARLILDKARYYGVPALSNEYLLSELFMLEHEEFVSNEQIEVLSEFLKACYSCVQEAQMSK